MHQPLNGEPPEGRTPRGDREMTKVLTVPLPAMVKATPGLHPATPQPQYNRRFAEGRCDRDA